MVIRYNLYEIINKHLRFNIINRVFLMSKYRILIFTLILTVLFLLLSACQSAIVSIYFDSNNSSEIKSIIVKVPSNISIPEPTREGYNFMGWFFDEKFERPFKTEEMPYKDFTLYSKWGRFYTITYYEEDGTKLYEMLSNIPLPNLTRSGNDFLGWYLDNNYTVLYENNYELTSDINLYAKWSEPEDCILTFSLINNDTEYELTYATVTEDSEMIIPNFYNDLPVTKIADSCLSGARTRISAVFIPENIEIIGKEAFSDRRIDGLTFSENSKLIEIGEKAFKNNDFEDVLLPEAVSIIGKSAFEGCLNARINIPSNVTEISDYAFAYCDQNGIVLHNGITRIGKGSFSHSRIDITELPENLIEIGEDAFSYSSIRITSIPDGVTELQENTFHYCESLTNIELNNNITEIGSYAFSCCTNLTSITLSSSLMEINAFSFSNCIELIAIELPNLLTYIGYGAFQNCELLEEIVIPDGVTEINDYTFNCCRNLNNVILNDNIISIGSNSFALCESLTSIDLPDEITEINEYTFYLCGLTSIIIPSKVTTINNRAFFYCNDLSSIELPESLEVIEPNAFGETDYVNNAPDNSIIYLDRWAIGIKGMVPNLLFLPDTIGITSAVTNSYIKSIYLPKGLKGLQYFKCSSKCVIYSEYESLPEELNWDWNIANNPVYWDVEEEAIYQHDDIQYLLIDGEYTVTRYIGVEDDLTVLAEINGYMVTTLSAHSFSYSNFSYIYLPDSIVEIGIEAFANCQLDSIRLSLNLIIIKEKAFYNCLYLNEIVIPESVMTIEKEAFDGTGIYNNVNEDSLIYAGNWVIAYNGGGNIVFNDSTRGVCDSAFDYCLGVITITISKSIEVIGQLAFKGCFYLENIFVDEENQFFTSSLGILYNKSLTEIICYPLSREGDELIIPDGIETISNYCFAGNRFLSNVIIPESMTDIGEGAFRNSNITEITIPDNVINIGEEAFAVCHFLTDVIIGDGVQKLSKLIFWDCLQLENISLGSSIKIIDYGAFYDCIALSAIIIPDGVVSIGDWAFRNCRALTAIVIPDSVYNLGAVVFTSCTSLSSIVLSDNITSFGNWVFGSCPITEMVIPDSVTFIGDYAFHGCNLLTSITLSNSIETIGLAAFASTALEEIIIPESIESIGEEAFMNSSNLRNVYLLRDINEGITTSSPNVFEYCSNDLTIYVPDNSLDEYKSEWSQYNSRIIADS